MSDRLALAYVEVAVPRCLNVYGTLPCNARLSTDDDPVAASFDGAASYLTRGAGLTGAADSKLLTVSVWFRYTNADTLRRMLSSATAAAGSTTRARMRVTVGGRWGVLVNNAAGTLIGSIECSALTPGRLYHALMSFDLSDTAKRHLYIDDVSDLSLVNTYSNDTIDFTLGDWSIGANPDGTEKYLGEMADLWWAPGVYIDFSIAANRRKFITADLAPVDLGVAGATPTGTAPLIFLSGDISTWHTNKGTGGGFTLHGALAEGDFATGDIKCFNTIKTCQDRTHFSEQTETLRFAVDTDDLPPDIDCLPFIASHDKINFTPQTISLGESLGTRATLAVTFRDARHSDTGGFDPYLDDRDYDPVEQGTFWGKFRARQPFLRGRACRLIRGFVGAALADMETRHFVIDSFDGPTPQGEFTIVAKDLMKVLDDDRAQAPVLSNGFLSADITSSATSAALLPTGIGNEEYPASGHLNIGGNEVVSFTRSGDNLTIARGQKNTVAKSHKAQDRCQLVLSFSDDVATIIKTLAEDYGGIDAARIPFAAWTDEVDTFLGNNYTADICEPTGVATLINELIQQAALAVWHDNIDNEISLQVLRAVPTETATFSMENTLEGGLKIKEQPGKRVSRVTVYFGQIDPTKPLTNLDNYRSTASLIDEHAERDYGSIASKTIISRWIPEGGRAIADTLCGKIIGRFRDPPRQVELPTMRKAQTDIELGSGYRVMHACIQDATGADDTIPLQIVSLKPGPATFEVTGEEMLWTAPAAEATDHQIILDASTYNVNLRTLHDALYGTPSAGDTITCTIRAGVIVGSLNTNPAFHVGSWPTGIVPTVIVASTARVAGKGGDGGITLGVAPFATDGQPGSTGLYTRVPVNFEFPSGAKINGGGGGGAGSSATNGGGGAGQTPGIGIAPAASGTLDAGGASGGFAGNGGAPGVAGSNFGAISGGAAGTAIDGVSFITFTVSGGSTAGASIN